MRNVIKRIFRKSDSDDKIVAQFMSSIAALVGLAIGLSSVHGQSLTIPRQNIVVAWVLLVGSVWIFVVQIINIINDITHRKAKTEVTK